MKKAKLLSLCALVVILLMIICPKSFADDKTTIMFNDEVLATKVENYIKSQYLGITSTSEIQQSDRIQRNGTEISIDTNLINEINVLILGSVDDTQNNITDLTGLETFENLQELKIFNGTFSALTPIVNLSKLEKLHIMSSGLQDNISEIESLTNLKDLSIGNCNINSLNGLDKLSKLEILSLGKNNVTDYSPFLNMTSLKKLSISTPIETLDSLKNMTNLEELNVMGCEVKDISALSNLKKLTTFRGDNNHIESIENLSFDNIDTFWVPFQKVKKFVKLSDKTGNEIILEIPNLFTEAVKEGSLIYDENAVLEANNGTISDDKKTVTASISDIKSGSVSITIANSGRAARESTVTYFEALEIIDVQKNLDEKNTDKVNVALTVNKRLDENKIPEGWSLSADKKIISKQINKDEKENITLTDIDGSTVTYMVFAENTGGVNIEELKLEQKEELLSNGKVKVTLTANKEIDSTKMPKEWNLSSDGKSIFKTLNQGSEENITVFAKDGSKKDVIVKTKVYQENEKDKEKDKDNTQAPTAIPQTGVRNLIVAIAVVAGLTGLVVFIKQRNIL